MNTMRFYQKLSSAVLTPRPADRGRCEKALADLYHLESMPTPAFSWAVSPRGTEELRHRATQEARDAAGPDGSANYCNESMFGYCTRHAIQRILSQAGSEGQPHQEDLFVLAPMDYRDRPGLDLCSRVYGMLCTAFRFHPEWVTCYDLVSWACWVRDVAGSVDTKHEIRELGRILHELSVSGALFVAFPDHVFLCDRPSRILFNARGLVHCEDGPAIEFRDGLAVYVLNSVPVPEWLVSTPAEQLEPRMLADLPCEPAHAELIRRIGAERVSRTARIETIDAQDGLELLTLAFPEGHAVTLLKRIDSPLHEHGRFVGVGRECRTVENALAWRIENDWSCAHSNGTTGLADSSGANRKAPTSGEQS
ncbi:MAG: hypothetical protein JXA69_08360 [Phycisphaerae bacterium]|nr:hypothetical protein [Phycisphaerae bacterium]